LAADETLSALWARGLAGENLDSSELARLDLLLMNIVAMITAQLHAHQRGYYDFERRIPYFSFIATAPGFQHFWQRRHLRDAVRADVREYVEALMERTPGSVHSQSPGPPAV
jgi:hypothetical protein